MKILAVSFEAPFKVQIIDRPLPSPARGELQIATECTAISAGTELLFYRGQVEAGVTADEALPGQLGKVGYPMVYGYCAVGEVEDIGPDVSEEWLGRRVFVFGPHQSRLMARVEDVVPLPSFVPSDHAVLLANMETAVSLVMDGSPILGERVAVLGQGMVGLLVAALLSRMGVGVTVIEPSAFRRKLTQQVCAPSVDAREASDGTLNGGFDLVFELTGQPAGLQTALALLRYDARLIIGSWYGTKPVELPLGTRIHRNRNHVLFSQVSRIDPRHAGRFDKQRRLSVALEWLGRIPVQHALTHRFPLAQAAEAYALLHAQTEGTGQVLIQYEPAQMVAVRDDDLSQVLPA